MWLEANPLTPAATRALLEAAPSAPALSSLGLDRQQLEGAPPAALAAAGQRLRASSIHGSEGPGYFKLETARAAPAAGSAASSAGSSGSSAARGRVLVVSFGSAPGTPNWGGVLGKVRAKAVEAGDGGADFDVAYIVDPHRSWYRGGLGWGGPAVGEARGRGGPRLAEYPHFPKVCWVFLCSRRGADITSATAPCACDPVARPGWTDLLGPFHHTPPPHTPRHAPLAGGDEGYHEYEQRLEGLTSQYESVVFIGGFARECCAGRPATLGKQPACQLPLLQILLLPWHRHRHWQDSFAAPVSAPRRPAPP